MATRVTRISATTSLLLALAAGVGLLLWPYAYEVSRRKRPRAGWSLRAVSVPPSSMPMALTRSVSLPCRGPGPGIRVIAGRYLGFAVLAPRPSVRVASQHGQALSRPDRAASQ
jgi:hypothetical protein